MTLPGAGIVFRFKVDLDYMTRNVSGMASASA